MDASFDERFSRLMIKESRSYYVSNVLWGNVADEVHHQSWLRRGAVRVVNMKGGL